jgi:hypothetical protein
MGQQRTSPLNADNHSGLKNAPTERSNRGLSRCESLTAFRVQGKMFRAIYIPDF